MLIWSFVPLPLMPLGVEHLLLKSSILRSFIVPLPLMPLGVEHTRDWDFHLALVRAFTFDAFRR